MLKRIRTVLTGGFIAIGLSTGLLCSAQNNTNATSVLSAQEIRSLPELTDDELASFLQMLSGMPQLPAVTAPKAGTFFSLQHPEWPPLPANFNGVTVWSLYGGGYLLDDLEVNYSAKKTKSGATTSSMARAMSVPAPPGGGDDDEGGVITYSFTPPVYTTNDLLLFITAKTNDTAWLSIRPPRNVTNGIYDLFFSTNLVLSHGWNWLLRTDSGQTNLIITNLPAAQCFFILGLTNDTDGDFLTDAMERLVLGSNPANADTDGDGFMDGMEVLLGTDPNSSDLPHPAFSVTTLISPANEGSTNGQFLITRTVKLTNAISVYYQVGGTAINGDDYVYLPGEAAFAPGQSNAVVTVAPVEDDEYEGNETVTLTLLPDFRYDLGAASNATVVITDDDLPPVQVTASTPMAFEGSTNYGVFTVSRSGNNSNTLAVAFSLTGTATNGVHYTLVGTNVTIGAGSNTIAIAIAPVNNTNFFGTRSVVLTLKTNVAYQVNGNASNAVVTIADDETASVQVVAEDNDAREGSTVRDGRFRFVRSSAGLTDPLTVQFAVHGTATPGADYDALPESVTIPAGTNATTLTVHPANDGESELRETVIVVLQGGKDYLVGTTNTATVFIDDAGPIRYEWEMVKASAVDVVDLSLPADVVIRRYGSTRTNVSFPLLFATNGSLAYPDSMGFSQVTGNVTNNYIQGAASQNPRQWVVFTNRASEAHIKLAHPAITGAAVDSRPYVNLFVTNIFGTTTNYQTVYFHGLESLFTLKFLTNLVTEGSTGTVLRVSRYNPGTGAAISSAQFMTFQLDGVATPMTDYTLTNLYYPLTNSAQTTITLYFGAGQYSYDVPLKPVADSLTEGYESVYARLDPLSPLYAPDLRSNWVASLNIRDTNAVGTPPPLDSDGDGMSDDFEKANGLKPYTFNDPYADSDKDGLTDVEEAAAGTNPNSRDSDGDGLDDYTEWTHGLNPTNAAENTLAALSEYVPIKLSAASCYKCHQTTLNAGQYHLTSVPPIRGHTADDTTREQIFQFLKGKIYPLGISGPVLSDTNGQYTAHVLSVTNPAGFFVDDPQGMLGDALYTSNLVGKTASLIVPRIELAVDKNGDGQIRFDVSDQTSSGQPYRFWVNNDNDHNEADNFTSTPDFSDGVIDSKRDLEDFSRLSINVDQMAGYLQSNRLSLSISWRSTTGTPIINLYRMADTNGSQSYLTDDTTAQQQITDNSTRNALAVLGGVGTSQYVFDADFWNGLPPTAAIRTLLFEGAQEGSGQLVLSLIQSNVVVAESAPIYLELKDIKKMYERAAATPGDADFKPPYAQQGSFLYSSQHRFIDDLASFQMDNGIPFEKPADETAQCVVFIHGWNMAYDEYVSFSETMFKRLWWQGYRGRFCAFRWSTLTDYNSYNTSEFRAWKYGESLRRYGLDLQRRLTGYSLNLVAHSMGNIVAGSALRRGLKVNNYALMQAAVPAGCYDTSSGINSYAPFLTAETNLPTPDFATAMGYRGYLTNVTGSLVNFFNPNDFALATGTLGDIIPLPFLWSFSVSWEGNQKSFKPDYSGALGIGWRYYFYPQAGDPAESVFRYASPYGYVDDPQEVMSFVARPRSQAVGAKTGIAGKISSEVNLNANFGFDRSRGEHSAEFNWGIQRLGGADGFYQTLYNVIR